MCALVPLVSLCRRYGDMVLTHIDIDPSRGRAFASRKSSSLHTFVSTQTAIAMGIAQALGEDTPFTMIAGSEVQGWGIHSGVVTCDHFVLSIHVAAFNQRAWDCTVQYVKRK